MPNHDVTELQRKSLIINDINEKLLVLLTHPRNSQLLKFRFRPTLAYVMPCLECLLAVVKSQDSSQLTATLGVLTAYYYKNACPHIIRWKEEDFLVHKLMAPTLQNITLALPVGSKIYPDDRLLCTPTTW